jgi:putative membrane protein
VLISNFNLAEIKHGQLAFKKAQNENVRKFAEDLVNTYTKLNKELQNLAADKKWKFTTDLDRDHQAEYANLEKHNGADFDRAYLQYQVTEHQNAFNLLEQESKVGTDTDLKGWATRTLPTVREHLAKARELNNSVNKPAGAATKFEDQGFVMLVTCANLAEIQSGQLAAKQGHDADVRKFAQQMVDDHTKANKDLMALAMSKKWNVATTVDRDHQAAYDRLAKLEGKSFDLAYLENQANEHRNVVALFDQASREASDADLKAWATRVLPALRDHEKMARDLWDKEKRGR